MPDRKISQLNELVGYDIDVDNDLLHIVDTSAVESKHIKIVELLKSINTLTETDPTAIDPLTDIVLLFDTSKSKLYKTSIQNLVRKLNEEHNTYSSGWQAVTTGNSWSFNSNGSKKVFTHGLNTTDMQISVYAAEDSAGTNATLIPSHWGMFPWRVPSSTRYGLSVLSITPDNLTIQLGADGYTVLDEGGEKELALKWTYIKVVCRK